MNKYNKRYTQFVAKCGQPESAIPKSIHLSQLMLDLDLPDSEEFNEVYFTKFRPINGKKYLMELNNEASLYALTSCQELRIEVTRIKWLPWVTS
ncbi:BgTH12-01760 [Blumeria graminis f. sp. triticale]|uniref:Bgt-51669 n=2 Tax=Blumeria graminis TaxID=34373 RepID=A0A9X9MFU0_BLUGR|nr:BgTH12-01760 [Blumeria graminis f. sp. triticale]VDB84062.1 Bgt-51669 [Blumeria graminis f. sp. tritici]